MANGNSTPLPEHERDKAEFPLRVFIDGNMLAVPLIHDLTSVGLKLGSDAQGNWWLTRKEVRHG